MLTNVIRQTGDGVGDGARRPGRGDEGAARGGRARQPGAGGRGARAGAAARGAGALDEDRRHAQGARGAGQAAAGADPGGRGRCAARRQARHFQAGDQSVFQT